MIYRLKFDRFRFLTFDISPDEWIAKLGASYIFQLDEPCWSEFWPEINGRFFNDSDSTDLPKVPDISVWFMQNLVLNSAARESLERDHPEWIESAGEILPIKCERIDYYVWHITCFAADDCIDHSLSERLVEESGHTELKNLAFKPDFNPKYPVFHTDYDGGQALFCTNSFRDWVDAAGLQGLVFSEDLVNPFD